MGGLLLGCSSSAAQLPLRDETEADTELVSAIARIRGSLKDRDERIKTAYVDFRIDAGADSGLTGRTEMYFSDGRYHVRHYRGGAVLVEVVNGDVHYRYTVDPDGNRTREATSRARRQNFLRLEMFLPSLSETPAYLLDPESRSFRGRSLLQGSSASGEAEPNIRRVAQSDNVLWIAETTGQVIRHEHFRPRTGDSVAQVLSFEGHVERDGVMFPTRIVSESPTDGSRSVVAVDQVEINGHVDPDLFLVPDLGSDRPARIDE